MKMGLSRRQELSAGRSRVALQLLALNSDLAHDALKGKFISSMPVSGRPPLEADAPPGRDERPLDVNRSGVWGLSIAVPSVDIRPLSRRDRKVFLEVVTIALKRSEKCQQRRS
jgi:hypothetical protein